MRVPRLPPRLRPVRPPWTDVLLALAVAAFGAVSYLAVTRGPAPPDPADAASFRAAIELLRLPDPEPLWLAVTLTVQCAPILWRRRRPGAAFLTVLAFDLAFTVLSGRILVTTSAELVLLYTVAAWRPPRRSLLVMLALAAAGLVQLQLMSAQFAQLAGMPPDDVSGLSPAVQYASGAATYLWAWWLGLAVRWVRQRGRRLWQERTAEAVGDERVRIARELNDLIAHHISGLVVQAGAATSALTAQPAVAREALTGVEDGARRTLGAMRSTLGLLRAPEPPPAAAGTPAGPPHDGTRSPITTATTVQAAGAALAASVNRAVAVTRAAVPAVVGASRSRRLRPPRPRWTDLLIATALFVAAIVAAPPDAGPLAWDVPLLALQCAPLLWRRHWPLQMLAVGAVAAFGYQLTNLQRAQSVGTPLIAFGPDDLLRGVAMFILCCSVAAYRPPATAVRALAVYGLAAWGVRALVSGDPFANPLDLTDDPDGVWRGPLLSLVGAALSVTLQFPWVSFGLGAAFRARRGRDARARERAVQDERVRIARELHDVVAHYVSGIVVQAAAARMVVDQQPDVAAEVLATIERDARDTLTAMRKLVGVLADEDAAAPLTPQPSIAQVDELVAWARQAGLTVHQRAEGDPLPLGEETDLFAYRIVQEALTNTVKHAAGAEVTVALTYAGDTLEVEVTDGGRRTATPRRPAGAQQGLIGMRERVALLGGRLQAGQRADGGWTVHAWLPANRRADRPAGVSP